MSWAFLLLLAQAGIQGTLAPRLSVVDSDEDRFRFEVATPEQRKELGEARGVVFVGAIRGARAFVTDRAVWVDIGGLKKFELGADGTCEIEFPLAGAVYKWYPVRVRVYRNAKGAMLGVSSRAFVTGSAKVEGREVAFAFQFDAEKNDAFADNGWQAVDGDEWYVMNERPVYHAAGAYFSIDHVDIKDGAFTLTPRTAAEYTRILLKPGEVFPDFSFTDFDGRTHRLSDYAGKRVLLDFWATWCAPCMEEIPKLREMHAKGLEMIGMNVDSDVTNARALNLPWVQASIKSIREIVEHRARIEGYPTYILLDGERRIVSVSGDLPK